MSEIFRYEVPVDDQWHEIRLSGGGRAGQVRPLYVAARRVDVVEFWAYHDGSIPAEGRWFKVVGTGHRLPEVHTYHGTALAAGGLVWHLIEAQRFPTVLDGAA